MKANTHTKKLVANVWFFMFCKLCNYASITTIIYHPSILYTGQKNKEAELPTKQGDLHRPWINWNNLKFLSCLIFEVEVTQMKIRHFNYYFTYKLSLLRWIKGAIRTPILFYWYKDEKNLELNQLLCRPHNCQAVLSNDSQLSFLTPLT